MKKVLALEKEFSRLGGKGESAEPTFFFSFSCKCESRTGKKKIGGGRKTFFLLPLLLQFCITFLMRRNGQRGKGESGGNTVLCQRTTVSRKMIQEQNLYEDLRRNEISVFFLNVSFLVSIAHILFSSHRRKNQNLYPFQDRGRKQKPGKLWLRAEIKLEETGERGERGVSRAKSLRRLPPPSS